jgi:RimJ/RimL family protein N-acetyltransferase
MPRKETRSFTTASLRLRQIREADAEALAIALADPALYSFIGGGPPTHEELRERIDRWLAGPSGAREGWHNWVIELEGAKTIIGHLQATVLDASSADIAWMVGTPWQGRGYASEAAVELVRWLECAGVETITAHIRPDHAASARVAQGAGLEPTDRIEDGEVVWRRIANRAEN